MEVLASLKGLFWKTPKSSIGVYKEGTGIFLVFLERFGEEWQLSAVDELPFSTDEDAGEAEIVADMVRMHCARHGWPMDLLSLCLSKDDLFSETIGLPVLEEADLPEAVHWEIEGQEIFGDREFRTAFREAGDGGNEYWVAAVEEAEEEAWEKTWREKDMERSCIVAMPPVQDSLEWEAGGLLLDGMRVRLGERISAAGMNPSAISALYAAMAGAGIFQESLCSCFSGAKKTPWNWSGLCLAVGCASLMCLGFMAGADLWHLHAAREAHQEAHQELLLLGKEQKKKDLLEKSMAETEHRDAVLATLSKESFPWYSLLVHFGTMTVEGVCIKGIALLEENTLNIEGEAVTFDALADFLKRFEGDKEFFSVSPLLENATAGEGRKPGEMVRFSLRLEL